MARRVKVYCLVVNTDQIKNYFFGSMKAAKTARSEAMRTDGLDESQAWIDDWTVELSRDGVADALNDFIDQICANE